MSIEKISTLLWGGGTLIFILGAGLYLSLRLKFIQLTRIGGIFSSTVGSVFRKPAGKCGGISPFQALSTVLAASMGTGNIAGVAAALTAGGSGAVLWMLISSVICSAAAFAENYLGIKYRDSRVYGAMAYIKNGLGKIIGSKPAAALAGVYAFSCAAAALGTGSMSQSAAAADALGGLGVPPLAAGIAAAVLTAAVIFRGGKSAAGAAEKLIPFVSAAYILGALAVTAINFRQIPHVCGEMLFGAVGLKSAAGGISGAIVKRAVQVGLQRGIFSNEAGLGSSVLAHSSCEGITPYQMGCWAVAEVFIDTVICCTLTAFAVLTSGAFDGGAVGTGMVTAAFSCIMGKAAPIFTAAATCLFAFASIIGWYFYGERCVEYLSGKNSRAVLFFYRMLYAFTVYLGAEVGMKMVWSVTDICTAAMLFPNMAAVLLLSREVKIFRRQEKG